MDCDLVREQSGVAIRRISNRAAFPVGHSRKILEILSSSMKQEFPTGETPKEAASFINRFMEVKGEFSQSDFRVLGWVYLTIASWWAKMVCFVLKQLEEPLLQCGLYHVVRAVYYIITPSYYNFFAILEKYNLDTCT